MPRAPRPAGLRTRKRSSSQAPEPIGARARPRARWPRGRGGRSGARAGPVGARPRGGARRARGPLPSLARPPEPRSRSQDDGEQAGGEGAGRPAEAASQVPAAPVQRGGQRAGVARAAAACQLMQRLKGLWA
ncbi:ubiquitin/ISG15-conjugating enzyme E2 L6 isoform X4 [Ovis aries]|uniref:ubiquitin/ISG15-conjugating enzyme E2 L6 isoform X4 n=1 Tax=Ovis aries TaxID=9940 RepID=UPI00295289C3|nr:ubiquitin/ISG15-conjugating enzyme E2 L6 isoform X4 [Ovis aries]